ncbi:hypothetical protein [Paenibacillus guangzhouensis]|uniref:hypothetical protein n=1 Tax=Paenibacillus guangzhouensis TaxID=1473112 RepID=UPI0012672203|nr:hypothetical protein [Paenibacillus guangzhouensis]
MNISEQTFIEFGDTTWKVELYPNGLIHKLRFLSDGEWVHVDIREGVYAGIRWCGEWNDSKHVAELSFASQDEHGVMFSGTLGELQLSLRYHSANGNFTVTATVKHTGRIPFQPVSLGLLMGLDTYMEKYPDWDRKCFPTLLRSERNHFWGYCMRPDGRIIGVGSPDPIASWHLEYNVGYSEGPFEWGGHRVESFVLDLLHALPLPERHPQSLYQLLPGEEKSWTIHMVSMKSLEDLSSTLAPICTAPFIEMDRTTIAAGETAQLKIHSLEPVTVRLVMPDGQQLTVQPDSLGPNLYGFDVQGNGKYGYIKVYARNESRRQSEAILAVRPSWLWFMERAREAALIFPQRATSHCESWYGMYTLYLAERYTADQDKLDQTEKIMDKIYPLMFDMESHEPLLAKHRIQNVSSMIGVLVDRYEATGEISALERASDLADWMIGNAQDADGSYRARRTHYTSVIYPAKSIMELIQAEKSLKERDPEWKERYDRHWASVRKAMDELVRADGNIDTEGELTYEDGMIACSALQLGLFALMQESREQRMIYQEMAIKMLSGHDCLTNLVIPDARQRGATRRFWESQYDVAIQPNMLNSPHGWTSWRIYATWYAYLLTGEVSYLVQTMNAISTVVQAVDMNTGELRWAFVPDPYIHARQISEQLKLPDAGKADQGHHHTLQYASQSFILGEQYIGMISDWHERNLQDNDVHEHFKCLEEVVLGKAYAALDEEGQWLTWNCRMDDSEGVIAIKPTEPHVRLIHVNASGIRVRADFDDRHQIWVDIQGPCWIQADGQRIDQLFL